MSSAKILLRALLKTLDLHCCRESSGELSIRNAECFADGGLSSQRELVHNLFIATVQLSGCAPQPLPSTHSEISLRHYST